MVEAVCEEEICPLIAKEMDCILGSQYNMLSVDFE